MQTRWTQRPRDGRLAGATARSTRRPWAAIAATVALLVTGITPAQGATKQVDRSATSPLAADVLEVHNNARREVGAPPLVWDEKLAADAQVWSDQIARDNRLHHDQAAENLSGSWPANVDRIGIRAPYDWYREKAAYDAAGRPPMPSSGPLFYQIGHYTQMIWADTEKVGCAVTNRDNPSGTFVTCRYYPPGNYAGRYPAVRTTPTTPVAAASPTPAAPSLVSTPFSATVGAKLKDGTASGTAKATATASPTGGTPTPAASPSGAAAGGGAAALGGTWDVRGDGSFLVSVTPEGLFTPSPDAEVTSFGTPSTRHRGYQVRYTNNSDTPVTMSDVALDWVCTTSTGAKTAFVLQPPGQGLPTVGEKLGKGSALFAFGCGLGDGDEYNSISLQGGPAINGASKSWSPPNAAAPTAGAPAASSTAPAATPVPTQASSAPAAPGTAPATTPVPTQASGAPATSGTAPAAAACLDATRSDLTGTAAAAALRCVVDQARTAQGLPATVTNTIADGYATGSAVGNGVNPSNVCSGKPPTSSAATQINGMTPQDAFTAAGGLGNPYFRSTTNTYLGIGHGKDRDARFHYGLFTAVC